MLFWKVTDETEIIRSRTHTLYTFSKGKSQLNIDTIIYDFDEKSLVLIILRQLKHPNSEFWVISSLFGVMNIVVSIINAFV